MQRARKMSQNPEMLQFPPFNTHTHTQASETQVIPPGSHTLHASTTQVIPPATLTQTSQTSPVTSPTATQTTQASTHTSLSDNQTQQNLVSLMPDLTQSFVPTPTSSHVPPIPQIPQLPQIPKYLQPSNTHQQPQQQKITKEDQIMELLTKITSNPKLMKLLDEDDIDEIYKQVGKTPDKDTKKLKKGKRSSTKKNKKMKKDKKIQKDKIKPDWSVKDGLSVLESIAGTNVKDIDFTNNVKNVEKYYRMHLSKKSHVGGRMWRLYFQGLSTYLVGKRKPNARIHRVITSVKGLNSHFKNSSNQKVR